MDEPDKDQAAVPELDAEFIFRRRPVALPGDLRPTWRIGLLVLLLARCCRQQRSSLTRMHVLNWAARSEANHADLLGLIAGRLSPDQLIVRFDPACNRAIDFAIGEGILERIDGSRIGLTESGKFLAEEIARDPTIYVTEKKLAGAIKQKASEILIDNLFGARK